MIYIVGVARSGKSTLADIFKEYDPSINVISTEAIYYAMTHAYSEFKPVRNSKQMASFVAKFAEWNEVLSEQRTIVDVGLMDIALIHEVLTPDDVMICLGFGGEMSEQEIWDLITKYHSEFDYTYTMGIERVKKMWGDFAFDDKHNKTYCTQHKLEYIDTSSDREAKLRAVVDRIFRKK